jgi:hypothetical protein
MAEETETYLRVLECVGNPDLFVSLLDPQLTLDARGTDNLWRCTTYSEIVKLVARAHLAGVRTEILDSSLVGSRMMLVSRLRMSPGATRELTGPPAGQTMCRVMTLRGGRIVHILDCAERDEAMAALLEA